MSAIIKQQDIKDVRVTLSVKTNGKIMIVASAPGGVKLIYSADNKEHGQELYDLIVDKITRGDVINEREFPHPEAYRVYCKGMWSSLTN